MGAGREAVKRGAEEVRARSPGNDSLAPCHAGRGLPGQVVLVLLAAQLSSYEWDAPRDGMAITALEMMFQPRDGCHIFQTVCFSPRNAVTAQRWLL